MPFKKQDINEWIDQEKQKSTQFEEAYDEVKMAYDIIWELTRIRKEAGLTQSELAIKANINQQAVSRIETGKHIPTLTNVCRIADQLGYRIKLERKQA